MNNNLTSLTKQLISFQSTKEKSDQQKSVLKFVRSYLKSNKVKSYTKSSVPSDLYYNTPKFPKKFRVILNAHLDVVPGKPKQFKPKIKGGKLYGRGAIDMKGGAAVLIEVFKNLADKVDYPLGLQLVTDEEIGGFDGTKHQIQKGVKCDFAMAGEPTDFNIEYQAKGIIWVELVAYGKSAHGAYPWKGENAVNKLNTILSDVLQKYPVPKKDTWVTTVNVSGVNSANETFNKVPDEAKARLDIRYIPEDKDDLLMFFKTLDKKSGVKVDIKMVEPSHNTDVDNKYIKYLEKITRGVTGNKPKYLRKNGGSDMRHFSGVNIPAVCFGPIGGGLHTDNEWVDLKSLDTYYKIMEQFLLSLNSKSI